MHVYGELGLRVIEYACPGGFAVVMPVYDQSDLWFILTDDDVHSYENIRAAVEAPPITRMSYAV